MGVKELEVSVKEMEEKRTFRWEEDKVSDCSGQMNIQQTVRLSCCCTIWEDQMYVALPMTSR